MALTQILQMMQDDIYCDGIWEMEVLIEEAISGYSFTLWTLRGHHQNSDTHQIILYLHW